MPLFYFFLAVAPRIGAASMIAWVMSRQFFAAMALDRLGWFEMAKTSQALG